MPGQALLSGMVCAAVLGLSGLLMPVGAVQLDDEAILASLPEGPGKEETFYLCHSCHSFFLVRQQRLSRPHWDELLDWMVEEQGMPEIEGEERDLILDYLETTTARTHRARSHPHGRPTRSKAHHRHDEVTRSQSKNSGGGDEDGHATTSRDMLGDAQHANWPPFGIVVVVGMQIDEWQHGIDAVAPMGEAHRHLVRSNRLKPSLLGIAETAQVWTETVLHARTKGVTNQSLSSTGKTLITRLLTDVSSVHRVWRWLHVTFGWAISSRHRMAA